MEKPVSLGTFPASPGELSCYILFVYVSKQDAVAKVIPAKSILELLKWMI